MKNSTIIIWFVIILCIAIIAIVKEQEQKKIEFNQAIDLTMKVEKIDCGDSLLVTDLTHPDLIKQIEKQLKNQEEVYLGLVAYNSFGLNYSKNPNYSKNNKFVYILDKSSKDYYEILIENRMLDNDTYSAKCLLIYVSCND
jgi:hypothetical protein